jgi:hypothetical protein
MILPYKKMPHDRAFLILGVVCLVFSVFGLAVAASKEKKETDFKIIHGILNEIKISKWWEGYGNNNYRARYLAKIRIEKRIETFKFNFDPSGEKDSSILKKGSELNLMVSKKELGVNTSIWVSQINSEGRQLGNLSRKLKNDKVSRSVGLVVGIFFGPLAYLAFRKIRKIKSGIDPIQRGK